MAAVIDARSREIEEQRERALRALLLRPLMTADDPAFHLVRAHGEYLRDWLARECGWVLRIERTYARLQKRPADLGDSSRGAEGFNRSRYVLLCLALAVLEREDVQITLQRLGERLIAEAAAPELAAAGFAFGLDKQSERRDLVQVCRLLLELGIISRVAGDEQAYINQSGDALYDINRPVLAALLAGDRGPSALTAADQGDCHMRLQALVAENTPQGEEARRTAIRHRLSRRLLDDPVVYLDALEPAEQDYFLNQRGAMGRRLAGATGLTAEHRGEGSALVDEDGDLTDIALPKPGTDGHAALLLAEFLAERLRSGNTAPVPRAEVDAFMRDAARTQRKYWRKATQEAGAERELAATAIKRLAALRLVHYDGETIHPLAAVCRFRLGASRVKQNDLLDTL
ncbi:MAG TPA: TIGR02678 family protein [Salinisphaeraceae bacterium]|nr:TIGR02678 family protein [Salinisphaeraceae bacterium]